MSMKRLEMGVKTLEMSAKKLFMAAAIGAVVLATAANAAEIVRHKIPGSDFPIALAVEIPTDAKVVNLSGALPSVKDADAPKGSIEAYGTTEDQTISTLENIKHTLESIGLEMGDVIKMQVFLVGDPKNSGKMDFGGFMNGYRQFFGTEGQPNLPTRSVFQVAGLASSGALVEIEVVAIKKPK
ncbi:hypothetical protein AGMMS50229_04290 [Campylobacterota bacterium]|nr:hypothetical protein AGMMS50229_04290 [Campylobacterota bacterium]